MNQTAIVPFGRYKGQPIEVLAQDASYVEWMQGQSWVRDKFPQFYTIVINNFSETQDTPEHNTLQSAFLDDVLCIQVIHAVCHAVMKRGNRQLVPKDLRGKYFESEARDVVLETVIWELFNDEGVADWHNWPWHIALELKPSLGDDYPGVLRQVQRLKGDMRCVVYVTYTGVGASISQVEEMFRYSNILLLSMATLQEYPTVLFPNKPGVP